MTALTPIAHTINLQEVDSRAPISRRTLQRMGESINFSLTNSVPLGTIIWQMLSQSQIDSLYGVNKFVPCDGRNVSGSKLQTIFGIATIPDTRGRFLRAKSLTSGHNPDGNLAVGSYTADKFKSHNHTFAASLSASYSAFGRPGAVTAGALAGQFATDDTGDNETAPKAVHLYAYIRIN